MVIAYYSEQQTLPLVVSRAFIPHNCLNKCNVTVGQFPGYIHSLTKNSRSIYRIDNILYYQSYMLLLFLVKLWM